MQVIEAKVRTYREEEKRYEKDGRGTDGRGTHGERHEGCKERLEQFLGVYFAVEAGKRRIIEYRVQSSAKVCA